MSLKNAENYYGSITKTLHWVTGIAVIALIGVGLYMSDMENSPDKFKIYGLHKSFGATVLILTALRIFWHVISKKPGHVESLKIWEKRLASIMHLALYAALIAMPLSGWLMSSAANFTVSVFGLFNLPNLVAPDKELAGFFREVHKIGGTLAIIMIGLHALAALKHHFIDKDTTLKRMLPGK